MNDTISTASSAAGPRSFSPAATSRCCPTGGDLENSVPRIATQLVLLGGVPGAGKSTLLRQIQQKRPDVRIVDPERLRDALARLLPQSVAYRCYRPLVHTLNAALVLLILLRGPEPSRRPVIVHDPATRSLRRNLMATLARRRGWCPTLLMLDVRREDALVGQYERGRVVAARSFDGHWMRWQRERPQLMTRPGVSTPWAHMYVASRGAAPSVLADLLSESVKPGRPSSASRPAYDRRKADDAQVPAGIGAVCFAWVATVVYLVTHPLSRQRRSWRSGTGDHLVGATAAGRHPSLPSR
jgi:AAA domain